MATLALLGLSLGGLVAMEYAGRFGAHLAHLIVVDIAPVTSAAVGANAQSAVLYPPAFESLEAACAWAEGDALWSHGERLSADLAERLRFVDGQWVWRADARMWAARAGWFPNGDPWHGYDRIDCPTLVIRGADSGLVDDATLQRMCLRNNAHGVTLAKAGHGVPRDTPHAFLDALVGFLRPCD